MEFPGKDRLPRLGVGLSFRHEIATEIGEHLAEFDFLEVILDNALRGVLDERFWEGVARRRPVVGHGINSSLGSLEPLDEGYLQRIGAMARQMQCQWFSDHLSFTRSNKLDVGQLMPVQFSEAMIAFMAGKIRSLGRQLGLPFLVENSAYYFRIPGSTLGEADFIVGLLQSAHCGLLLDVNNLYANAVNHDYDPYAFIDRLPAAAVVEIHVAGGERRGDLYVDTHGHPVTAEVLGLLDYAIATKQPNAIVLEREQNFPPMSELIDEIRAVRRLWQRHAVHSQRMLPSIA
jgi:hypothetical protein